MVLDTTRLLKLCPIDGGRLEEEIRGNKLIRTCMRCGMEERLDYKDPDEMTFKRMEELERSLTEDGPDLSNHDEPGDSSDEDIPTTQLESIVAHGLSRDEATQQAAEMLAKRREKAPSARRMGETPTQAAERERKQDLTIVDWKEAAKAKLTDLIAQIEAAEKASIEALEIHTALTACGISLPPLPRSVSSYLVREPEPEAEAPSVLPPGRPKVKRIIERINL